MKIKTRHESGRYLYAITDAVEHPVCGDIGINGRRSMPSPKGRSRRWWVTLRTNGSGPERKNLAAHNAVVKRLMEDTTILPVAFGTIADGPQAVREISGPPRRLR